MRQNLADQDQVLADLDQTNSDRDQTAAERDQLASDADQAASDRDLGHHREQDLSAYPDYQLSRVQRLSGTAIRHATRGVRTATGNGRDLASERRDANADLRDEMARRQDLEDIKAETTAMADNEAARGAFQALSNLRSEAAADREVAAADRERAAAKRREAADRRLQALDRFRMANQSELTGVLYRGAGERALEAEFRKAREDREKLWMVGLCLDGQEESSNPSAAGDGDGSLLKTVADQVRSRLPDGTPIVSFDKDSLLFTVPGVEADDILERLGEIDPLIAEDNPGLRVALGRVELEDGDSFSMWVERSLAGMREARVRLYDGRDGDGS
ncbi:MAG: hypothetical protein ACSLFD_09335 [Solirubrobacterales bacterium]